MVEVSVIIFFYSISFRIVDEDLRATALGLLAVLQNVLGIYKNPSNLKYIMFQIAHMIV